jgi:hypothetical protein
MEIGFSLEFTNFLPKYILTEFMINYGRFQKDDIIWKYGIVFEKFGTTAFVECLFHDRKIVYKSDTAGDFEILKYEVFDTLRNINRNDKNLKISLDTISYYPCEVSLYDSNNPMFRIFGLDYENYIQTIKNKKSMTLQEKLDQLILNDQTVEALSLLLENSKSDKEIHNTLILLNSRFVSNESDFNKGIVSRDDYKRSKAQVIHSLQQTIVRIPVNFLSSRIEGQARSKSTPISHKEKHGANALLDTLIEKRLFLENELILTYDAEKKFALQKQIKDLGIQIEEMKQKI